MNFIKKVWRWLFNSEKGLYLVFGALTTLVSLIVYYLLIGFTINIFGKPLGFEGLLPEDIPLIFSLSISGYIVAFILRNVAGILFAYFTNRGLVFGSKAKGKARLNEFLRFISSRLITLVLDVVIGFILVEVVDMGEGLAGLLSMIAVIIMNYILSKLFVFNKKAQEDEEQQNAQKSK